MGGQLKGSKFLKSENGFVLAVAIVILSFLTSSALYLLTLQAQSLKNNKKNYDYEMCIFIGYNALAKVQGELKENLDYKGTNGRLPESNGGFYRIVILKTQEKKRSLEVISEYGEYKKKFTGRMEIIAQDDESPIIKVTDWKMEEV